MNTLGKHLLFPPVCAGCGERFTITPSNPSPPLFCTTCEQLYERAMREECSACNRAFYQCTCMPSAMKRAGVKAHVKLAPYGEGSEARVMRHIVLEMKKKRRDALAARCAADLSPGVLSALLEFGIDRDKALIVALPRGLKNRRRYGLDQAQLLALALSNVTQIPVQKALLRQKAVKVQKTLSEKERAQNMANAFVALPLVKGYAVILVDDVVTTGSSMQAAAKALLQSGATAVIGVSLASVKKKRKHA